MIILVVYSVQNFSAFYISYFNKIMRMFQLNVIFMGIVMNMKRKLKRHKGDEHE